MNKMTSLLTLLIVFSSLQAQTLIPFQSSWKYLDDGSNQGAAWRTNSFNDASWKTGNGKFGFGITDATTIISFGSNANKKFITTYFRKTISITNPSVNPSYTINIKRDDGVIVYINETEVYRNNLPGGSISSTTLASEASDNGYTPQTFTINASTLVSGNNLIAVEVHQAAAKTPDMAFDLELTTPPDQPPSVISINRQSPVNAATNAASVTFRVTFSEKVNGVDQTDFNVNAVSGSITGTLSNNAVTAVGTDGTTYDVTVSSITGNGTLRLDLNSSGTGITDITGNAITGGFTAGQTYMVDQILPTLSPVSIASNNSNPSVAIVGNVITLTFTASEPINTPVVTIATHPVTATTGGGNNFTASYAMTSADAEGIVPFTINFTDIAGNAATQVTSSSNGSSVLFNKGGPTVLSINRQSPAATSTNSTSVTFRAIFSETVNGVDRTDFVVTTVSGTVTGTLGTNAVAAVGTGGTTYDVTVGSITGNGTLRLDLKSSGTGITNVTGTAITGGFTTGQTYIVDQILPTLSPVSIASNNSNPSIAGVGNLITLSFTASEPLNTPTVTLATHAVTASAGSGNSFTATYTMTSSDVDGNVPFAINFTDIAGNAGTQVTATTNGSSVLFNKGGPAVLSINRQSPAAASTNASSVTFRVTFSKGVTGVDRNDFSVIAVSGNVTGSLGNKAVSPVGTGSTTYDVTVGSITGNGTLRLDLKSSGTGITDFSGVAISGGYTSGETYIIDKTAPTVTSINRQFPAVITTNSTSLTYRVIFTEKVKGVDYTDFTATTVSGSVSGSLASNAVLVINTDSTTYDVTVTAVSGSGTLRLDLKSGNTGITDAVGNAISGGYTSGQTYTVQSTSSSATSLNYIPTSVNTGEKPQSKVWNYNGYYWAVLPNSTGTYLWRLDGTSWTSVLKLSNITNSHADCKRVGNITHILLFQGFQGLSAQLVSVEYVSTTNTYQLWSARPSSVDITLDPGVETAVIDIDGRGRMWLTSTGVSDIIVRWSDAPYSTWSSPITVATGVKDDDICDIIYMPNAGQMGVLWSNQNTKRFGFKTHTDGAMPSAWSADEVPASQSAINFGKGMADDHLNFALASDGTLYCAVKTSYDATGYPKIALLVRRPNGSWDNLYEVSQTGTRGIALLNEALGKLKIVYTSNETGGNILYKETSISNISFGPAITLLQGTYNNATSTKENYNSDIVILAGDTVHLRVAGILLTDAPPSSAPDIPVLAAPSNGATGVYVNPTALSWNAAAGATSYRVQVSTVPDFVSTVFDQTNINATSTQVSGLANSTIHYWRVKAINVAGGSDWSQVWSFTTASNNPLVAQWKMDEGSGTTLTDASEYGNNGTTVGGPVWVTGKIGQALQLDGSSQYATVSNSGSLNPTSAITLTAWIKPEKLGTQYIIKKAILDGTDGYELSLSNAGQVFFRVNQKTSQNTNRVISVTSYPTDGNTWMHVAATFDGSDIKLYINGTLDNSVTVGTPVTINSNSLAVGIGAQSDGASKFQGAIDDGRIYNAALSASDILNIIAEAPPIVPVLAAPANGATGVAVNPAALSWNAAAGATSYRVQVSTVPDFVSTVFDQTNINATSIQVSGLANSTIHYWRVKAINGAGSSSDWSQVWSFTTASNNPLVAQWKMDEGSGTTLTDTSEYGNNGTTVGGPVWVTGKIGQALQLDGSSQYATVSNSGSLNPTSAITLTAWIKPEKLGTQYIIKKAILDGTDGYELSLSNAGQVFFRVNQKTSQNTNRVISVTSYPTDGNTWMHVAATFDGSDIKLYINGTLDNSVTVGTPVTINSNSLAVGIGAQSDGASKFQGAIDDGRIYNAALSASDILNIIAEAPPIVPVLAAPANGATGVAVNPAALSWNAAAGATSYRVQVSTVPDFVSTVFDQTNINATSIQVSGLANSTIHYWRVKAINGAGSSSDWSQVWSFTTASNNPLVAQWKMDEGSGTTLTDASEYGNNGTTVGGPVWVTGKIGQALQLDGSSQYATVSNSGSLNPTSAITLTAWIKPEKLGTQYIIKKAILDGTDGYELSLSNAGQVFFRVNQKTSQNTNRVISVTSYPTDGNTWMHVAATFDGSDIKLYINGTLDNSVTVGTPVTINSNSLAVGIGAQSDGASKFQGAIDDGRIYNAALSASDILNIIAEAPPIVPVLAAPANGATGVAVNPAALSWNAAAGATSYRVQVSTVPDFVSTVFDQTNINATSIQVSGLANSTIHYWRVKAINGAGSSSDWSQVWSFTTASNNPLVAQWKMDEGSGTTLTDASEYGNNGTTVGGPVWVTGKIGQALQLDGSSQYATVSNSGSLNPTSAITLTAWIKPEKLGTQYIIKKAILDGTDGYELSLSNAGQVFFRVNQKTSQNTNRVISVTSYPTDGNTWMHVAATFDGSDIKLYINGTLDNSVTVGTPVTINSNSLAVGIGAQSDGASKFQGAIDDGRIYNTALNASDIVNIVAEAPPIAAVLSTPANSAIGIAVNPTPISWNAETGADSYQVQISPTVDFASLVFDQNGITTTTASVPGLNNYTTYYWRVRASNTAGNGDWSAVWTFKTISNSSLVGYWQMDEGSGTTLLDASEYVNNGTTTGNPVWVTGQIGQALQLNGSSQYATVPNNPSLNPTTAITLSAWIKPELSGTQNIIKKAINSITDGYELSLSSTGKVFFRINQKTSADVYRVNSVTSYPTDGNTWMHVAATFDGSVIKLYINGTVDNSVTVGTPVTINSNSLAVGIGAQSDGASKFKGAIDDGRIYNIALSASEIANLATVPASAVTSSALRLSEPKKELFAFPNPFSSKTTIQFILPTTGDYSLGLYDMNGKQIILLKKGKAIAGEQNSVEISGLKLAHGMYIIKLQTANGVKTLKLLAAN